MKQVYKEEHPQKLLGQRITLNERRINFVQELRKYNFFYISSDFNTVIFANKNEIFLLELKQGYSIKREICKIVDEKVRYVK